MGGLRPRRGSALATGDFFDEGIAFYAFEDGGAASFVVDPVDELSGALVSVADDRALELPV